MDPDRLFIDDLPDNLSGARGAPQPAPQPTPPPAPLPPPPPPPDDTEVLTLREDVQWEGEQPDDSTTLALGEEGEQVDDTVTTQAIGEEGEQPDDSTTLALGEEGEQVDDTVTTQAIGEEGEQPDDSTTLEWDERFYGESSEEFEQPYVDNSGLGDGEIEVLEDGVLSTWVLDDEEPDVDPVEGSV